MLPRCPTKSPCQSAVIFCHGKKYLTATHFLLVVTFSLLLSSCSHCNISLLKNQGGKKNIYFSILKYYYRKTAPEFFWYAFQCSRLNHSSMPLLYAMIRSMSSTFRHFFEKSALHPCKIALYIRPKNPPPHSIAYIPPYIRPASITPPPLLRPCLPLLHARITPAWYTAWYTAPP